MNVSVVDRKQLAGCSGIIAGYWDLRIVVEASDTQMRASLPGGVDPL